MKLDLYGMVNDSIVDGPGLRFSVFVQGCPHNCPGCQNPDSHAFGVGTETDTSEILERIKSNPLLDGVTFSGGEPFCQAKALAALGKEIRALGLNIVTFTGYTFEYLYEHRDDDHGYGELLAVTDILIDGRFIEELRSLELRFRGSSNQRIIDVLKSLAAGKVIEAVL
jgi:anaerobic ribonucleoside-triphosphate reductase activating protein